jgi:hypothetical protein
MKNVFFALAAIFTLAFAPTANASDNFNNNTLSFTAVSGALDFTLDANRNGLTEAEVGAVVFRHSLGGFDADVRAALRYNLDSGDIALRGEYGIGGEVATNVVVYGVAAVEYVTSQTNLRGGDFHFNPSVGAAYHFTDRVALFGEVGYTWDISNSWNSLGGYVEVGVPFSVTNNLTVTPSVVRQFHTGDNSYQLNLGVAFTF